VVVEKVGGERWTGRRRRRISPLIADPGEKRREVERKRRWMEVEGGGERWREVEGGRGTWEEVVEVEGDRRESTRDTDVLPQQNTEN